MVAADKMVEVDQVVIRAQVINLKHTMIKQFIILNGLKDMRKKIRLKKQIKDMKKRLNY